MSPGKTPEGETTERTATTDHARIGTPDGGGLMRLAFGDADESLEEVSLEEGSPEEVSWDDVFDTFERSALAFLYQEASESRFNTFIRRNSN
ncbi:hypothetical protein J5J86_15175 [Aquabacter sp. L1I39]|uniref:hypothetical protein n=1 Tax=Aquabacter sp. L1I39 TaxID=2820278 RepID=UPI001ADB52EB|nr:hypothetical protein [Aquabacter sp. L1I39]QTL02140.1 hypothetical protein J5J86_15175 [Aquabacter sp. L1I39]